MLGYHLHTQFFFIDFFVMISYLDAEMLKMILLLS